MLETFKKDTRMCVCVCVCVCCVQVTAVALQIIPTYVESTATRSLSGQMQLTFSCEMVIESLRSGIRNSLKTGFKIRWSLVWS